jgi:hypothetical protein
MDPQILERAAVHLEGLDSNVPETRKRLLGHALGDQAALARDRRNLLQQLVFNSTHPAPRGGSLMFGFHLPPPPEGADRQWYCTAVSPVLDTARPFQPSDVLTSGTLDAWGNPELTVEGRQRLHQALASGQSLIFHGPAQRNLLKAEQGPEGLLLNLDVRIVD